MRRKIASGFRTTWLDIVSLFWRPHGYDVIYAMHQSVVSESLYGDALLVCTSAACMQMSLTHDCHCISGFSQHTMLSVVQSLWTIVCCGVALYILVNESNPSSSCLIIKRPVHSLDALPAKLTKESRNQVSKLKLWKYEDKLCITGLSNKRFCVF